MGAERGSCYCGDAGTDRGAGEIFGSKPLLSLPPLSLDTPAGREYGRARACARYPIGAGQHGKILNLLLPVCLPSTMSSWRVRW